MNKDLRIDTKRYIFKKTATIYNTSMSFFSVLKAYFFSVKRALFHHKAIQSSKLKIKSYSQQSKVFKTLNLTLQFCTLRFKLLTKYMPARRIISLAIILALVL